MKLYYSDVLSPHKVCAVARYLGSPVEYLYLDLTQGEQRSPGYLALNPSGKVPTLVDGDLVIWEADAVMCHLAARAGSELWPRTTDRQIDVIRWLSWNHQHFYSHGGALYFQHIIKPRFGLGAPDPVVVEEAMAGWRRFAAVLEGHLASRRWLLGDALTVADFAVGVVLPYASQARVPLDEFSAIVRWHERLNELPGWREPFPARCV
jgi:glutathione S-transferase